MHIAAIIRAVRRHRGISQRELAQQLTVAASTVAAWESGVRQPPLLTLEALLAQLGFDLVLCRRAEPPDDELLRFLSLPLTVRLRLALGERPSPYERATGAAWTELLVLGRLGTVMLHPPVAAAMWVPATARARVAVTVHEPRAVLPPLTWVDAVVSDDPPPASRVPVTLVDPVRVWVLPPGELLLDDLERLRQAATALDADDAVDDAGRRRPAHRDPNEWRESARMLMTKGTDGLPRPRGEFGRAWRLGAPVSLAQTLRQPR